MLTLIFAFLLMLAAAGAQAPVQPPPDARATSPTLEDVPYPHPVSFLPLTVAGRDVRMAYMDVRPAGPANGRTVVLLHGLNFYGEYWAATIDALRNAGFRVVVPDQVGFGRSSKVVMPYTFSGMALNTRRLLNALGIERAAIVGHSMGGMLAARFALLYPDVTERLVLYNQIGLTDARLARPPTPTDEVYQQVLRLDYAAIYQSIARYFPNGVTPVAQKYITRQYGWTLSGNWPEAAMVRALAQQMVYEDPVVYDWPRIRARTLEIGGEKDGATPNFPALAKQACDTIPSCQLVLFPNVGHVPHLEVRDVFHRELLKFLLS
ncbi:MAG: alpha/beta hydrolase [Vicinamibacterales bacterium]